MRRSPWSGKEAAIALAELGGGDVPGVARELAEGIRRLAPLGPDQAVALRLVARAERLARVAPLPHDVAERVAALLYFFPRPAPDYHWPRTWLRAARLLGPDDLRAVVQSGERMYLTALGALTLARSGFRNEFVDSYLANDRDYHLLTPGERCELEPLVSGELAREELRRLAGSA